MQIGEYEIEGELARGGMGVVYRARDPRQDRAVVVKLVKVDDANSRKRLEREAKAMARIEHPHVVPLLDFGVHRGRPYLVLPLVEGESLQDRLSRLGQLSVAEAVGITIQIGKGLQAVHALGLLHRDVKPDNVLLGAQGTVQLTDFGLVKSTGPGLSQSVSLTVRGRLLGTPGYWPKEQALGVLEQVGPAADVYALGATLFALLSGLPPRATGTLQAMLSAFQSPAIRVQALREDVPDGLDALLAECLSDDPEARPGLSDVLQRLGRPRFQASDSPHAPSPGRATNTRHPKPAGRSHVVRGGLALAGVASLAALGLYALPVQRDTTPPVLTLEAPAAGSRLAGAGRVTVRGTARDPSGPVKVTLGDSTVEADAEGGFVFETTLGAGQHTLTIHARDAAGNTSEELELDYTFVPEWYTGLDPARRTPLPLPEGVEWGELPGDYLNVPDGSLLRWIPPGSYRMGSDDGESDEYPSRLVELREGFFLAKHETSWAQYRRFCAARGAEVPENVADMTNYGGSRFVAPETHPVFGVSREDAMAYCAWAKLRLPSEAEWEYAARGPSGLQFPWGNQGPDATRLNLAASNADWDWPTDAKLRKGLEKEPWDDGFGLTSPVGSFPRGASPFGCLDMAGNVWEWVQDDYQDSYIGAPTDGTAHRPAGASHRVRRGGSWNSQARWCRAANRGWSGPGVLANDEGFRPARSR